ncbi:S41 family peptidase [Vibrio ezurae]|uniref:Tricorn protease homolog n=1 Tax=Vibrio ezurae NBRC 102218 TaxID=1219080 RepID=U3B3A9_9VIBR|nr:S41 family peptidase [Vibrio ezurae]GAD79952.1 putative tricorn protease homolog [Vibrio ezurae NBRC 102218]
MFKRLTQTLGLLAVTTSVVVAAPVQQTDTANSANWYRDAAVSPDGSQIVFRYAGQLWLVPSTGGDALPLTSESVFSSHPVWSPNGKSIAFTSNRYGSGDVFTMDVNSGQSQRLTYHPSKDVPYSYSSDGSTVYFASRRIGNSKANMGNGLFGAGIYLYSVNAQGGREHLELGNSVSSFDSAHNAQGFLYTNRPSIEQEWRKHQTSASARDIWLYKGGKHLQLTYYKGEDRDAHWSADDSVMYYLSERSGSFNVWRKEINDPTAKPEQQTFFDTAPLRSLSVSNQNDLVFSYDGDIWIKPSHDAKSHKVAIHIRKQDLKGSESNVNLKYQATEFAVSPSGKEAAIVARGDIFVVSMSSGSVVRVTHTAQQEKDVSFSKDGKSLYYSSERNGNWDIFRSQINAADSGFVGATSITETAITQTPQDEIQPVLSPDNQKVAYRVDINSLVVENLGDHSITPLIKANELYSYSRSDWSYSWSPDSQYIISRTGSVLDANKIVMFDTTQKDKRILLSQSGFGKYSPTFSNDGQIAYWVTTKDGVTELDGSPTQLDVYGVSLNKFTEYNWFKHQDAVALTPTADNDKAKDKDDSDAKKPAEPQAPATRIEEKGLAQRVHRLTPLSLNLEFAALSPDNKDVLVAYVQKENLVFATFSVATQEFTPLFTRPAAAVSQIQISDDGSALNMLGNGTIESYSLATHQSKTQAFDLQAEFNFAQERNYIFDHVWRLTEQRFYNEDLHGVDWAGLKTRYARHLPAIHTYEDFAILLSEMVGELNASHTGASFHAQGQNWEKVGSLGLFYDDTYQGEGVRVDAVLDNGPADLPNSAIVAGSIIKSVNGIAIQKNNDIYPYLRNLIGKPTTLGVVKPDSDKVVNVQVFPIDSKQEQALSYQYWVNKNETLTDQLSKGKVGYVHVPQMNSESYKELVNKLFGENRDKDAVVIDIRFNTGGNLHDQIVDLLSAVEYGTAVSRDGYQAAKFPIRRWTKPTVLLVNSYCYSDASVMAQLYQDNKLGKVVGDTVPGTGTFVNWQHQQNPLLIYGVPQLGVKDKHGNWLENQEIVPDVIVHNYPDSIANQRDVQLETAVKQLLPKQ